MTLFDSTSIGKLILPNRFIRAATGEGVITPALTKKYESLAEGGVGAIISGIVLVSENEKGFGQPALYDDSLIDEHKKFVDVIHDKKNLIVAQLCYGGSFTVGSGPFTHKIFGPSSVKNLKTNVTPVEADITDIKAVQKAFADAALRAKKAGYDGIELHAAHDFYLSQFLPPYYNHRNDSYGGSLENRSRNLLETTDQIRAVVGPDYPIWVKVDVSLHLPPSENIILDDVVYLAKQLSTAGINAIEVSGHFLVFTENDTSYYKKEATVIAEAVSDKNVAVILTGGNRTCEEMTEILRSTKIGYFGLSRPLIKDPSLVKEWKTKYGSENSGK